MQTRDIARQRETGEDMIEFGVFTPEGCLERQLYTLADAQFAADYFRDAGQEEARAEVMCPDHEKNGQPLVGCDDHKKKK